MNYDNEIWKDVPKYEGLYQASSFGRIKAVDRKLKYKGKNQHCSFNCEQYKKEKILKQKITKDGYYEVGLNKNGKAKYIRVHRIIANTFLPNSNNYPVINHKNRNRLDNRVENIEWCSVKYNVRYSKAIKVIQMDLNNNFIKEWECMSDIKKQLGIAVSNISACCKGKYKQTNGYKWKYKEVK